MLSVSGASQSRSAPLILENLAIHHNRPCQITLLNGTTEDNIFTIISCTGSGHTLHNYFLSIISPIIEMLGPLPTRQEVNQAIETLIELFTALTSPPRKTTQGLWSELYLIARSLDPIIALESWHLTPAERYDFNSGQQRLEVKSSSNRQRQHHFSLEQLNPPSGTNLLIASIFVEPAAGGASISDLIQQITSRLHSPVLANRLNRIITLTLGSSWRNGLDAQYDQQLAEQSLQFYEPQSIPSINSSLPSGVSSVHFVSDLSHSPTANLTQYTALGNFFSAVIS